MGCSPDRSIGIVSGLRKDFNDSINVMRGNTPGSAETRRRILRLINAIKMNTLLLARHCGKLLHIM
jgi:hypothetical protein